MILTAPDLLKRWRTIVNDNVMVGRDSHALKEALLHYTPAQILYGFYCCQHLDTITIPQFLKSDYSWLEEDEIWAEIELARCISKKTPPYYWVAKDAENSEDFHVFIQGKEAKEKLIEWSKRILG